MTDVGELGEDDHCGGVVEVVRGGIGVQVVKLQIERRMVRREETMR